MDAILFCDPNFTERLVKSKIMADLSQDDINLEYVDVQQRFPSSLALKKNSASMKKFRVQRVKVCRSQLFSFCARNSKHYQLTGL